MSAANERDTPAQTACLRAMIAEIEARLAHFGRLTAEIRQALPEHHAQDLTRIEQGIGGLAQRISALWRESERARERVALSASPRVPPTDDDPWDPQSAEELMRVYEAVSAEGVAPAPRVRPHFRPWSSREPAVTAAPEPSLRTTAWLEARFAGIAALIERALAAADPAPALASLDRRLDQFGRRLDGALGDLSPEAGRGDLKLFDAHLVEFTGQVEAVRQQLNRLDSIDAKLRELARAIASGEARADQSALNEAAVAQLIDSAAERAASKVAQSLPALDEDRIDTLEALVRDHVAERRQSEEASADVLHSIEDTLVRIVDRVEGMEAMPPPRYANGAARDSNGLQAEHDRLAAVYAEGARVLGMPALPPTLDAADYVAADRQQQRETSIGLAAGPDADDWATRDESARQELRASALRAKLKAQALAPAPVENGATQKGPPESLGPQSLGPEPLGPEPLGPEPLGPESPLGQGRVRTWALTTARGYRASLLLGIVMALLFGAGFIAVDSMLAAPPPAATQGQESVPMPGSPAGSANISPAPNVDRPEAAPLPQPAPRQPLPDAASDEAGQSRSTPTPRFQGLQRGTASLPASDATSFLLPACVSPPRRAFA